MHFARLLVTLALPFRGFRSCLSARCATRLSALAAGLGTVFFGLFSRVGDYRLALLCAGFLFVPAALIGLMLPEPPDEQSAT